MALTIDFNICVNSACDTFTLTETTGKYSVTNIGGWGSPNPLTSTINGATLQVTSPSGVISTINIITNNFPTSNYSYSYDITSLSYEDGKWDFLLYYTDGVNYYMKRHIYFFYCNYKCCIDTMLAALEVDDCDCCNSTTQIKSYLKAVVFLDILKNAAKCQQEDNFETIRKILDKICLNKGCKSCK